MGMEMGMEMGMGVGVGMWRWEREPGTRDLFGRVDGMEWNGMRCGCREGKTCM